MDEKTKEAIEWLETHECDRALDIGRYGYEYTEYKGFIRICMYGYIEEEDLGGPIVEVIYDENGKPFDWQEGNGDIDIPDGWWDMCLMAKDVFKMLAEKED